MTVEKDGAGSFIHATAVVEEHAILGAGSKVWHHAHVRSNAVIGRNCLLGKNVFVDEGVRVGNDVRIQNNVSVYAGVELADGVFVGPSAVFTNDRWPRAGAHSWQILSTIVGRGATIGANATVVAGIRLGEWSFVGAGSVVTRAVRPHEVVAGNPARTLAWICRCAQTRTSPQAASLTCEHCETQLQLPTRLIQE